MKPRIAVIIGSTRDARFGEKAARWVLDHAKRRSELEVELLDIRDFNLPFFNEATNNHWSPSKDPAAIAWQKKLATFDGFIFVTAEYNRSIPASLKNALDHASVSLASTHTSERPSPASPISVKNITIESASAARPKSAGVSMRAKNGMAMKLDAS